MQPKTIDVVIDDYLHKIVRSRPWTKAHEERLLNAYADWLYEQPDEGIMLEDAGVEAATRYATVSQLTGSGRDELHTALRRLFAHGARSGWIEHNPFDSER